MGDFKKMMAYALSSSDITNNLNCKLVTYREIMKMKTLSEVMGEYKCAVILYEAVKNHGHWCTIFQVSPDLVEFFDPYGHNVNYSLTYADNKFLKDNNIKNSKLIKMLIDSDYKDIEYNNFPIQSTNKGIATCGRHVLIRCKNRNLTLDQYYNKLKGIKEKTGDTFDEIVTKLTINIPRKI